MFYDNEQPTTEHTRQSLDKALSALRTELITAYLDEIKAHKASLADALKTVKKFDAFGNEITPEGKDEEVWEYFATKNLWEKIYLKNFKARQAHYLDRLEDFLSATVENPERHIELFGRGLIWRYYVKSVSGDQFVFDYLKTDDPLDPLTRTLKALYHSL